MPHFEVNRLDAMDIANPRVPLEQALGGEVLAKAAMRKRRQQELASPERVVLGRIRVHRLLFAAVHLEIGLFVPFDVEPPDVHATRHRRLEDGGEDLLAAPFDFARPAHAHGDQACAHGPKLDRAWIPQRPSTFVRM